MGLFKKKTYDMSIFDINEKTEMRILLEQYLDANKRDEKKQWRIVKALKDLEKNACTETDMDCIKGAFNRYQNYLNDRAWSAVEKIKENGY